MEKILSIFKNKFFLGFSLIFLVIIALYFSIGLICSALINEENICEYFKKNTGLNLKLSSARISTLADLSFSVKADEVLLSEDSGTHLLELKNSYLRVRILPLILKKLSISNLSADKVKIAISRDLNGVFNFEKYVTSTQTFPLELSLSNTAIKINDFNLSFGDDVLDKNILITSNKINVSKFSPNKRFFGNIVADLVLFDRKYNSKMTSIFDVSGSGKNLLLNKIKLNGDKFSLIIDGKILNVFSDKRILNISAKIDKSDLLSIVNFVPEGVIPYKTDIIKELKKAQPYAILSGNLDINGNDKTPNVTGKLVFDDVYLFEKPINYKPAHVECIFRNDVVDVDVLVWDKNSQQVSVKGTSRLYGKLTGDYHVVSSKNVDLSFAQKRLIPVQRVLGFKLGPVPEMQISGTGNIDIKTSGTIDDAVVYGDFFAKDATARLNGLNSKLQNGNLHLIFDRKVIKIDNMTAKMDGADFFLNGTADDYNNLDIIADIKNLNVQKALNIANTSYLLKGLLPDLSFVSAKSGNVILSVKYKGQAKTLEGLGFSELKPQILLDLNNIAANLNLNGKNIKITNLKGRVDVTDDYKFDTSLKFKNATIFAKGDALCKDADKIKIISDVKVKGLQFTDVISSLRDFNYLNNHQLSQMVNNSLVDDLNFNSDLILNITGEIPVDFSKINPQRLLISGSFLPYNSNISKNIKFAKGKYDIKNSNLSIKDSQFELFGANILLNGDILKITSKPVSNLNIIANKVPVRKFVNLKNYSNSTLLHQFISSFDNFNGHISADFKIKKNIPSGKISFENISAHNAKQNVDLKLNSGTAILDGSLLSAKALNFTYGNTPFYFDAKVNDFNSLSPKVDAYFTTNLDETSVDLLLNPYLSYPLKINEEIFLKGRVRGEVDNYTVFTYLTLPKGSDIYYMGANFADTDLKRELSARLDITKNIAKVTFAKYTKFVASQNNKFSPVVFLEANGKIIHKNQDLFFDNFSIITKNPISAKLFNLIFKKSILKHGDFVCNLNLNGDILKPKTLGTFGLKNVNIPLYDTKITDAEFKITDKVADVELKGKSFESDVDIVAKVQNNFALPIVVESLDINSQNIDLARFIEGFSQFSKVSTNLVPGQPIVLKSNDLILKSGTINAQNVSLYDINAKNLSGKFSNPLGKDLIVDDVSFDIAGGKITTNGKFDPLNLNFDISSRVDNCDANELSTSFLGLNNQIFGKANAKINLNGKIPENIQALNLIKGNVEFLVNDGKMPKLGSLEYLLRAGNLFKSGFLGLTLNNIIEVLTPYKTGEFSSINGKFNIADAKINNLEIFSKGENLSLFIYGDYDIFRDDANIEVLGRLSKNVSNVLGPIGNASINSILSLVTNNKIKDVTKNTIFENVQKIPLIGINTDDYRLFVASIVGQLNSDNYVKSFNWLN